MIAATVTYWVFVTLGVIAFAIEIWALVDGARRSTHSFEVAEKRTKAFWMLLMALGALFGYLSIPRFELFGAVLGAGLPVLFMLVAVLPGAIYLADVKPEVVRYGPRRGR